MISLVNVPTGYYKVGDECFDNKHFALIQSSKTGQNPEWIFHNDTFDKFDWTVRPPGTLKELYKQRAQQIRDEYDYITIHFSGGMDSWTVLHSFLSNGIHVDEVYTRWSFAARKYMPANNKNTSSVNVMSEYEYTVVPVLDYVRKNFPKTNVVVDDISEEFTKNRNEEKILFDNTHYVTLASGIKWIRQSEQEALVSNKNKKIAQIIGAEKVMFKVINGNFYAYFLDSQGNSERDDRTLEFFFTTPKFPLIPILQAHYLKDFIKQISANGAVDYENPIFKTSGMGASRIIYGMSCYPDYNINTFQTKKQPGSAYHTEDLWIKQYNPKLFEQWDFEKESLYKMINKKYKRYGKEFTNSITNDKLVGSKFFSTKNYLVSTKENFLNVDVSYNMFDNLECI
jgi:uncharacterized protein YajQ (UPF0234 family)